VTANTQITRTATTNQKVAASAQPWLLVDLSRKKKTSNSQLLLTQSKDCLKAILRDIFIIEEDGIPTLEQVPVEHIHQVIGGMSQGMVLRLNPRHQSAPGRSVPALNPRPYHFHH